MKNICKLLSSAVFLTFLAALIIQPARAQESLQIDIFGPGQDQINVFVAPALPAQGEDFIQEEHPETIRSLMQQNLSLLPFLSLTSDEDILGGAEVKGIRGADIDFRKFNLSRADMLITIGIDQQAGLPGAVEIRAFEVYARRMVLGKAYTLHSQDQIPKMVRRFCADLMEYLTGQGDFFRSVLAFERKMDADKEIWAVTPLGSDLKQMTSLGAIAMSPDWSLEGDQITFTLLKDNEHLLGILNKDDLKVSTYNLPGNTIISPTFSPNGHVAVSLDPMGKPDIYWLDSDFNMDNPVVENWAIDVSPSFDKKGQKMAFTSARLGNPHIFVLDLDSNQIQRVSYEGKYNTNPSISPDGRYVAFSRQTPDGHRIFLADLETEREKQISFGPGNDEDPSFAPDGYFIAFSSSRGSQYNIYLTTRNADEPVLIPTGKGHATAPAWGIDKDL